MSPVPFYKSSKLICAGLGGRKQIDPRGLTQLSFLLSPSLIGQIVRGTAKDSIRVSIQIDLIILVGVERIRGREIEYSEFRIVRDNRTVEDNGGVTERPDASAIGAGIDGVD
jgi:hypothetical protein